VDGVMMKILSYGSSTANHRFEIRRTLLYLPPHDKDGTPREFHSNMS